MKKDKVKMSNLSFDQLSLHYQQSLNTDLPFGKSKAKRKKITVIRKIRMRDGSLTIQREQMYGVTIKQAVQSVKATYKEITFEQQPRNNSRLEQTEINEPKIKT